MPVSGMPECGKRMNAAEITELFKPWRTKHARKAWKPVVHGGDVAGISSWFGGRPAGRPDDEWPACEQCHAPMRFFVQLDLLELPDQPSSPLKNGLLQLFYCSTDNGSCETWAPFTGTHSVRVAPHANGLIESPRGVEPLTKKTVVRWELTQDYPHPEEHADLGVTYKYDFKKKLVDVISEDPSFGLDNLDIELGAAEAISLSLPGDKLRGWPYWVQGAEYPQCPNCASRMQLLLQIDSNDNLDYMFGDAGCAHLTYCPQHPSVFAFGWACG